MKQLLISIWVSLLLVSALSFSLVAFYYEVDNASFTELFCENKVEPELLCSGKCYLNELVAQSEQPQNSSSRNLTLEEIPTLTFFINQSNHWQTDLELPVLHQPDYLDFPHSSAFLPSIWQPPCRMA